MTALYAIGDIHGQLAGLTQAIEWIEKDGGPEAPIVFLGDYIRWCLGRQYGHREHLRLGRYR